MQIQAMMWMKVPYCLSIFFLAAVHLLLFSIRPVSSRIYETNDAVVIEVDLAFQSPTRSARSSNYGNPAAPIPRTYAVNPYTGYYYQQQQPNFLSWLYPLNLSQYKPASSSAYDVPSTSPEWKQQKITCGVGPPPKPPARQTPAEAVRIVGGTQAIRNSWPFVVGLLVSSVFKCGGTLISPTRILTAAHCVNKLSTYEISTMSVSLGMHTLQVNNNLDVLNDDAQQTRRVTRAVYHKDYNDDNTYEFDVAVLTIDPPVSYSTAISPVCLPPASTAIDPFLNKDAAIMGWGATQPNPPLLVLQQTTVKVISNAVCNVPYTNAIKPQQFCAKADGKDACKFDDGGPLVVQKSEGSPWFQAGVISSLTGCANPAIPSVYANVAFFRNWIETYMNE